MLPHGIGRNAASTTGIVVVVGISVVVAIAERRGTGNTLYFLSFSELSLTANFAVSLLSDFRQPFNKVISKPIASI